MLYLLKYFIYVCTINKIIKIRHLEFLYKLLIIPVATNSYKK